MMRLSAIFFSLLVFFPIALASAQDQPASARPQQQSLDAGRGLTMLRLLTIVSGAFEALFGVAAMLATSMVTDALGTGADPARYFSRAYSARRHSASASPHCWRATSYLTADWRRRLA